MVKFLKINTEILLAYVFDNEYHEYLEWLADYLYTLDAEPNDEQQGLCKYVDNMVPEDAIQFIGMNAALYQLETEPMKSWIKENAPFSEYSENKKNMFLKVGEEYYEEAERELYERACKEMSEQQSYCPNVQHADVFYRVPLIEGIEKEETKGKRVNLLNTFYQIYNEYIMKIIKKPNKSFEC